MAGLIRPSKGGPDKPSTPPTNGPSATRDIGANPPRPREAPSPLDVMNALPAWAAFAVMEHARMITTMNLLCDAADRDGIGALKTSTIREAMKPVIGNLDV